eukprot:gene11562-7968_t
MSSIFIQPTTTPNNREEGTPHQQRWSQGYQLLHSTQTILYPTLSLTNSPHLEVPPPVRSPRASVGAGAAPDDRVLRHSDAPQKYMHTRLTLPNRLRLYAILLLSDVLFISSSFALLAMTNISCRRPAKAFRVTVWGHDPKTSSRSTSSYRYINIYIDVFITTLTAAALDSVSHGWWAALCTPLQHENVFGCLFCLCGCLVSVWHEFCCLLLIALSLPAPRGSAASKEPTSLCGGGAAPDDRVLRHSDAPQKYMHTRLTLPNRLRLYAILLLYDVLFISSSFALLAMTNISCRRHAKAFRVTVWGHDPKTSSRSTSSYRYINIYIDVFITTLTAAALDSVSHGWWAALCTPLQHENVFGCLFCLCGCLVSVWHEFCCLLPHRSLSLCLSLPAPRGSAASKEPTSLCGGGAAPDDRVLRHSDAPQKYMHTRLTLPNRLRLYAILLLSDVLFISSSFALLAMTNISCRRPAKAFRVTVWGHDPKTSSRSTSSYRYINIYIDVFITTLTAAALDSVSHGWWAALCTPLQHENVFGCLFCLCGCLVSVWHEF